MTGLDQSLIVLACACIGLALFAINGNRSLAKDCRTLRDERNEIHARWGVAVEGLRNYRNEHDQENRKLRDLVRGYEAEVRELEDKQESNLKRAWSAEKELWSMKVAALQGKPFLIGMSVGIKSRPEYAGRLLSNDKHARTWKVRVSHGGCLVDDQEYHESLLEHVV